MVTGTNLAWQKHSPSFLWPAESPPTGDRARRDGAFRALSALGPSCSLRGIITVSSSQLEASSRLSTMSPSCQGRRGESVLEKPLGLCSQREMERRKGKELTLKEHLLYSQHCAGLSARVTQLIFNQPCEVSPSVAVKNLPKVAKLGSGLYGRGLEPRAVGLYVVGGPWHSIFQSQ